MTSLKTEISQRKDYLTESISTIYFGGGTPSVLTPAEVSDILETLKNSFVIDSSAEITLEANPDDLSLEYLFQLKSIGINRLSIGIQSFDNEQLKFIKRRHSAIEAIEQIKNAKQAGFNNISIDLIYGLPLQTLQSWKEQLSAALQLNVQHISAYGLMYEKNTLLWKQKAEKQVIPASDEKMNLMYNHLVTECEKQGFNQYEISNFAKPDFTSRHNTSYWNLTPYLGLGPAAHSFDGNSRQWNVSSNSKYCVAVEKGEKYFEREELTAKDKWNDYMMIRLRTLEGIDLNMVKMIFGAEKAAALLKKAQKHIIAQNLMDKTPFLKLTQTGILISNQIIMDLMED